MIIRDVDSGGFQFRVILEDGLNPEDLGMVQALKARSGETSEVVLKRIYAARRAAFRENIFAGNHVLSPSDEGCLDNVMAVASHDDASALARRLFNDYAVNYNHKSILDCAAGVCLIVEGCSMLCAEALLHHPLYAGQATSSRAINFAEAQMVDPLGAPESRAVQRRWVDFYVKAQGPVADEVRRRYPCKDGADEKKYEGAVKYRTFDVLRAWIPAGATTNVTLTMNLRQLGDHLSTLLLHPLAEVREVAHVLQSMLRERYPSSGTFGGAAGVSGVGVDGREWERYLWNRTVGYHTAYQQPRSMVSDVGYDDSLCLFELLSDFRYLLDERPRGCLLPQWVGDLGQVTCSFDVDFGSYRDLQRHRNGVCRMPLLTTKLGFEPWYLDQLPEDLRDEAVGLLDEWEHGEFERSHTDLQYYIPMGYRVPASVTYGLPTFVYVVELRSTPQVHPTLRRAVLKHMVKPFRTAHPEVRLHVDDSEDPWDLRRGQQTIERQLGR